MTASLDALEEAVRGWLDGATRPLILGLCGAQGSGKSTLSEGLASRLHEDGLAVAVLSLDDLYLSQAERAVCATSHPLFATRGVPGTHDVDLGLAVLGAVRAGHSVALPRFDKSVDEPCPAGVWPVAPADLDLLIFEGWCVGARPQNADELVSPVNDLEAVEDADGVWRRAVNLSLETDYAALFSRLNRIVLLAAPGFEVVERWRTQQEHDLRLRLAAEGRTGDAVMTDAAVARFIQHYERLTRHILNEMPARADLVLRLDEDRQLKGIE